MKKKRTGDPVTRDHIAGAQVCFQALPGRSASPLLNPQMMSETVVRPSASDSSFFTKSKTTTKNAGRSSVTTTSGATGATKPIVVTRVVTVRKLAEKSPSNPTQSISQSRESTPGATKKRKAQDTQSTGRPVAKKSRTTSPTNDGVAGPSRSQTPVQTLKARGFSPAGGPGTPEPGVTETTSRSRSVTAVPNDTVGARECWTTEDGTPGTNFKSCEQVVKGILKQYKTRKPGTSQLCVYQFFLVDFRNPGDPNDRSFEAHPIDYPTVELEFPNTNASET